ncbi:MAG: hypothetical protein KAW12_18290 [Candidatus Aminicenantes bacterium]|nr:hypothetical protein [Candidatus Aminicenantes bacterium]
MKKTIFLFLVTFLVSTMTVEAFVVMNDVVPAFPQQNREKIEAAVIEGTIRFLQAKSYADLLLKEYEKSAKQALDYTAALDYAEKTITELETAKREYETSIAVGSRAGYAAGNIQRFKTFDYGQFESGKELDNHLMTAVKSYFSAGDILGAYQENIDNIDGILTVLQQIREKLKENETPDIELFWNLLQRFTRTALFGNYCTMTAAAVLK